MLTREKLRVIFVEGCAFIEFNFNFTRERALLVRVLIDLWFWGGDLSFFLDFTFWKCYQLKVNDVKLGYRNRRGSRGYQENSVCKYNNNFIVKV